MANQKDTDFPSAATLTGAEIITAVQSGANVQMAINGELKTYLDSLYLSRFTSSAQTITSGGSLTIAHGLGAIPFYVSAYIQCTSAEAGYSIGDKIYHPFSVSDSAADGRGVSLSTNGTTNIDVRFGSQTAVFLVNNKTTGAGAALTNSSWKLYVIAQK